jgi:uncharacterized protein (TIGR02118 family)
MAAQTTLTIHVSFVGSKEDRFDWSYYVRSHLPLVMSAWGPLGLLGLRAFHLNSAPLGSDSPGTIEICECVFRDEEAVAAAFASERTAEVMADVERFTDLEPGRTRAVAL